MMKMILTIIIIALSIWHFIHGRVFFNTLMRIKKMNRRNEVLTEEEQARHSKDTLKVLSYSIALVFIRLAFLFIVYPLDEYHWPTWIMWIVIFASLAAYEQATQSPRTRFSILTNAIWLVYAVWILFLLVK